MRPVESVHGSGRSGLFLSGVLILAVGLFVPSVSQAQQYFGQNKVHYDDFDTRVLESPHFDTYFYQGMETAIEDVSRMAERWYERLARIFQHDFAEKKPLIFYADHPDFQQTNTVSSRISEGTGGLTEGLKNRVVMPISGSYASTDHVLGHELVHAFQYNIAQSRRGGGMQGLSMIPLWMIEGLAEYLSIGNEDPLTAMWMRDAVLRDDFPTLSQLSTERRFFPYRFGQAFWAYVGGRYGDESVISVFRTALRIGWDPAISRVLGISSDSLSMEWRLAAEEHFRPMMVDRTPPGEAGTLLMAPSTGGGDQNVAPSISPDGRFMVVMSEKDLFSFNLYLVDARTGDVIRTLANADSDSHMDALRFIDSSGSWSPDGEQIAIVTFAGGKNEIVLIQANSGRVIERLNLPSQIGEITSPSWSPDGGSLVFSGQVGGLTDLYLYDLESDVLSRLTNDRHAVLQPVFSPSGNVIAFVSDRGEETDFDRLIYSEMQIVLYHLDDGQIEVLDLFGDARHINPQFSPDGQSLYFVSDPDGFSNIYRVSLADRSISRVTNVSTAVSGIGAMSPAMSVARETGTVVFSVFDDFGFHVYSMDSRDAPDAPILAENIDRRGRFLPLAPDARRIPSRVSTYLANADTGLHPPGTFLAADAVDYRSSLSLDYISQVQFGAGSDAFGTFVSGSVAFFFSDMLGNRMLAAAIQAQGGWKDIGGQVLYQNLESRWNWGATGGRIPYLMMRQSGGFTEFGTYIQIMDEYRIFHTQAMGIVSYPFSTRRRVEFTGGINRYSFDIDRLTVEFDPVTGWPLNRIEESLSDSAPDPLNLAQSSVAFVTDYSSFGYTSPVRGGRSRFEIGATVGTLNYVSVNLDYRRYFNPLNHLTFAFRGLHQGRYGKDIEGSVIPEYFLGWPDYVRGYANSSWDAAEDCTPTSEVSPCAELERLLGHRIGVVNAEIRVPLMGTSDRYGLLEIPFLPTEFSLFVDGGVAWDSQREPTLEWSRDSVARIPVFSSGMSIRMNLLGYMVLEVYRATAWQRPAGRSPIWGIHLSPGW